jgi:hypothetical protein
MQQDMCHIYKIGIGLGSGSHDSGTKAVARSGLGEEEDEAVVSNFESGRRTWVFRLRRLMANLSRRRWPPGSETVFTSGRKNLRFHLDGGLGSAPWDVFKLSVPNFEM